MKVGSFFVQNKLQRITEFSLFIPITLCFYLDLLSHKNKINNKEIGGDEEPCLVLTTVCQGYLNYQIIVSFYDKARLLHVEVIYFCDAKLHFQHHYSSLQCVMWSFRNHSNVLICWSRNIYHYQCFHNFLMNTKLTKTAFIWNHFNIICLYCHLWSI